MFSKQLNEKSQFMYKKKLLVSVRNIAVFYIVLSYIFICGNVWAGAIGKPIGVNWALGKPAAQSSTYGDQGAHKAVDNNTWDDYSYTVARTLSEYQAWWEVDLEAGRYIEYINVWGSVVYTGDLSNFYVLTSEEPFVSTSLDDVLAQEGVSATFISDPVDYPTTVPVNITMRYIRIQAAGSSDIDLTEVEAVTTPISFVGKAASQSSTLSGAAAGRAIDGNTSGAWADGSVSCTGSEYQPWWEVDLGEAGYIDNLNLWSDALRAENLAEVYLLTSVDPFVSGNLADVLAQEGVNAVYIDDQPDSPALIPVKAKARYVRLQSAKTTDVSLSIAEIENVIPPVHAFQPKPASQSSTAEGRIASRATDGNISGDWDDGSVTSTANEYQPWLEVDLESVKYVDDVKVWNRTDAYAERLSDFYVLTSVDPFVSGSLVDVLAQAGVTAVYFAGQAGRPTTVSIDAQARYVRVQLTGTNYLHIAELQVLTASKDPLMGVFDEIAGPSILSESTLTEESYIPGRQWFLHSNRDEDDVFHKQLYCHDTDNTNYDMRIKIGKGGNPYSIDLPGLGETEPAQKGVSNAWMHNTFMFITRAVGYKSSENIHGAGMSMKTYMDPLINKPFYCPMMGEEFDSAKQSYSTMNWGLISVPSENRSEVMYYANYRYMGSGVLEVTYYVYNFGTQAIYGATVPWTMWRNDVYGKQIRALTDRSGYEYYPTTFLTSETRWNLKDSGGWRGLTANPDDPESDSVILVHGVDQHYGEPGYEYLTGSAHTGGGYWEYLQGRGHDLIGTKAVLYINPGEGFYWRTYLVFGELDNSVDIAWQLVDQVDYGKTEFTEAETALLPLYKKTESGQSILTKEPNGSPVAHSYSLPVKNSFPLLLLRETATGTYVLTTDPYALCGRHPTEGYYQVYDGKTEWVAHLGYIMPESLAEITEGTVLLSDFLGEDYNFDAGELLDANELLIRFPKPVAEANGPYSGTERIQITFDGSGSYDLNGDIVSYEWAFGDSSTGSGVTVNHAYCVAGEYTVALTVTDNEGFTDTDTAAVTVDPVNPKIITASCAHVSYHPAENAFDGNSETYWLAWQTPCWIQCQYEAGGSEIVAEYAITSGRFQTRDPKDWSLLGSNDGGATWDVLDTRTNESWSSRYGRRSFRFSNSTAYNIYRLDITASYDDDSYINIAEIELISVPFDDGDVNKDGEVNMLDLSIISLYWLSNPLEEPLVDINCDEVVNLTDFAMFADDWLKTK